MRERTATFMRNKSFYKLVVKYLYVGGILIFGAGAFSTHSSEPVTFIPQVNHRRLFVSEADDIALYRSVCEGVKCDPACAPFAVGLAKFEDAFSTDTIRWRVMQVVSLSDDPTIRAGLEDFPKEFKKLEKLLEKEKKNDPAKEPVKKFLLKESDKAFGDADPDAAAAFRDWIESMTEAEVRDLVEALLNLSSPSFLGVIDRARVSLLQSVGAI